MNYVYSRTLSATPSEAWSWPDSFLDLNGGLPAECNFQVWSELDTFSGLDFQPAAGGLSSLCSNSSSTQLYESSSNFSSISNPAYDNFSDFLGTETSELPSVTQSLLNNVQRPKPQHSEIKDLPEQMTHASSSLGSLSYSDSDTSEQQSPRLLPPAPRPFNCGICPARFAERRQLQ
jgi:hypothetical protein